MSWRDVKGSRHGHDWFCVTLYTGESVTPSQHATVLGDVAEALYVKILTGPEKRGLLARVVRYALPQEDGDLLELKPMDPDGGAPTRVKRSLFCRHPFPGAVQ